jgi:hypothetical protein
VKTELIESKWAQVVYELADLLDVSLQALRDLIQFFFGMPGITAYHLLRATQAVEGSGEGRAETVVQFPRDPPPFLLLRQRNMCDLLF